MFVLGGSFDTDQYLTVLCNNSHIITHNTDDLNHVACDNLSGFDYVPKKMVTEFDCRGMETGFIWIRGVGVTEIDIRRVSIFVGATNQPPDWATALETS